MSEKATKDGVKRQQTMELKSNKPWSEKATNDGVKKQQMTE